MDEPLTMNDLPAFEDWSLNDLEAHVEGRRLDPHLKAYLGNAWRVVGRSDAFDSDAPGSACAGFVSLEPPPPAAVELGRKLAAKYGW